ncbi:hypothetical protein GOP47_0004351 [Adiantum capillus-veneris]|uniref:Uncharacterized protein n=1 Tax=Adiantum capillus-veneris TaxID=13818 RepID=A0A9D4V8P5_ADICA|nr:hypothetical protein GOP47_0004351 [Adiantum capillus-veneris]
MVTVEAVPVEFVNGGKRVVPKEDEGVGVGLLWRRVGKEEDSMKVSEGYPTSGVLKGHTI